jgi:DNA-binding Lrp family transcriptional regulator
MKENSGYFIQFPTILLEHLNMRRAVLVGVLTSMSNKHGYAYAHNETLAQILKVHVNTLKSDLQNLESMGIIKREVIRNENKEVIKRKIFLQHSYLDTLSGHTSPQNEYPPSVQNDCPPPPTDCTIDKDIDINKNDKISDKEILFEKVWEMYGRVGNKKTSSEKWDGLKQKEKETISQHIPVYIKNHKDNEKMDYVPHFTTYLNQERWNDDLPYKNFQLASPENSKNKATLTDD